MFLRVIWEKSTQGLKKYLKLTQASEGDFNYFYNTKEWFFPKSHEKCIWLLVQSYASFINQRNENKKKTTHHNTTLHQSFKTKVKANKKQTYFYLFYIYFHFILLKYFLFCRLFEMFTRKWFKNQIDVQILKKLEFLVPTLIMTFPRDWLQDLQLITDPRLITSEKLRV